MKAPNLLIFRSQELKLGDLGISVKLDPKDKSGEDPLYTGKGLTKGFVTAEYEYHFTNELKLTKNQMFDCD